jgi:hypothetical protein
MMVDMVDTDHPCERKWSMDFVHTRKSAHVRTEDRACGCLPAYLVQETARPNAFEGRA